MSKTLKHTLEHLEDKNIIDMVTLSLKEYKDLRNRGDIINQHVAPNMNKTAQDVEDRMSVNDDIMLT